MPSGFCWRTTRTVCWWSSTEDSSSWLRSEFEPALKPVWRSGFLLCFNVIRCWPEWHFRRLLKSSSPLCLQINQLFLFLFFFQSFNTLHMMYHEATACHVTGDLVELLSIFLSVLKATRPYLQRKGKTIDPSIYVCWPSVWVCLTQMSLSSGVPDVKQALIQWQERIDFAHKLLTLLNSYSPPELRNACLGNQCLSCVAELLGN